MTDELLRHPLHSGHLTVGALKRNKDKPVLFLGDTTLTGGQLADRISQYIQAFEALGAGTGAAVGLLVAEPARGADDHRRRPDAGLPPHRTTPSRLVGRPRLCAERRRDHVADHRPEPDVRRTGAGAAGEGARAQADPDDRAGARCARGRRGRPQRRGGEVLAAAVGRRGPGAGSHRRHGLHRRHDRQAEGRDRHRAVDHHDDDDPARRVGVARESEVPDVHAAVACGRGVLRADDRQGRRDGRARQVRSGRGAARPSRSRRSRRRCWCRR